MVGDAVDRQCAVTEVGAELASLPWVPLYAAMHLWKWCIAARACAPMRTTTAALPSVVAAAPPPPPLLPLQQRADAAAATALPPGGAKKRASAAGTTQQRGGLALAAVLVAASKHGDMQPCGDDAGVCRVPRALRAVSLVRFLEYVGPLASSLRDAPA